ncbi:hypothetical protein MRX96_040006 [Rhipicephalus microplus]
MLRYTLHYFDSQNPGKQGSGHRVPLPHDILRRTRDGPRSVGPIPLPDFPKNIEQYRTGAIWLLGLALLSPVLRLFQRLCDENTSGLKEFQRLMGLADCFYWTGHFTCSFVMCLVHSGLCVYIAVMQAPNGEENAFLDKTDPSLLFFALTVHNALQLLVVPRGARHFRHVFGVFPVNVVEIWCVNLATAAIVILLVAYTSNVLPWNKVIPLHPLFLFKPTYWYPPSAAAEPPPVELNFHDERFEPAPRDATPMVHVRQVVVSHGAKDALKKVSFQAFEKQATLLVGRNGAGKTTLMNVVAGEHFGSDTSSLSETLDSQYLRKQLLLFGCDA